MITLNEKDPDLVGKEYEISYVRNCPFTGNDYEEDTLAMIVNYFGDLKFYFDDAYGQETCSSFIDVKVIKEVKRDKL